MLIPNTIEDKENGNYNGRVREIYYWIYIKCPVKRKGRTEEIFAHITILLLRYVVLAKNKKVITEICSIRTNCKNIV
jgi:hypothetical protein